MKQHLIDLRHQAIQKQQLADQEWLRVAITRIEKGLCDLASSSLYSQHYCAYHTDDDEPDLAIQRHHRQLLETFLRAKGLVYRSYDNHISVILDFLPSILGTTESPEGDKPESPEVIQDDKPESADVIQPEKSFVDDLMSIHEEAMRAYVRENEQTTWTPEDEQWLEAAKQQAKQKFEEDVKNPVFSSSCLVTLDHVNGQRRDRLMQWAKTLGFKRCEICPSTFFTAHNKRMTLHCHLC